MANVFEPEFDAESERDGFRYRRARLGWQAGSEQLGVSLYEIPPGQATFPYHWHAANEEMMLVFSGRPSVRTDSGWRRLATGEVVASRAAKRRSSGRQPHRGTGPRPVREHDDHPRGGRVPGGKLMVATRAPGARGRASRRSIRVTGRPTTGRASSRRRPRRDRRLHRHAPRRGDDDGASRSGITLGDRAGAEKLGASLYELPPGQAICPYHWHAANEELMVVVAGTVELRGREGWRSVPTGEVVAFPRGEAGAHQVRNPADATAPARVIMFSEKRFPEIPVYPDSEKVGVREAAPGSPGIGSTPDWRRRRLLGRRAAAGGRLSGTRIGVVGAGTMGAGIAQLGCLGGFALTLHDSDPQALATVRTASRPGARGRGPGPLDARARRRRRRAGCRPPSAWISWRGPELVIEAAPEDLGLKRELFDRLAAACGPEAVLATNTFPSRHRDRGRGRASRAGLRNALLQPATADAPGRDRGG